MARIVNVSKEEISNRRVRPGAQVTSDLVTAIQGNAALTYDTAIAGLDHEGGGTGCPLGLPYQSLYGDPPTATGVVTTSETCVTGAMIHIPEGEPYIDVHVSGGGDGEGSVDLVTTANVVVDGKAIGPDGTVRLNAAPGLHLLLVRKIGITSLQNQQLSSLVVSFPGNSAVSNTTGNTEVYAVPAAFQDIDDTFAASGLGFSGYHAKTMQQNLLWLEEYITGGPAYPNLTPQLSTFYVPAPPVVPLLAQSFGWVEEADYGGAGLVADAPGITAASVGAGFLTTVSMLYEGGSPNLKITVLVATKDKSFGSTTVVTARARTFNAAGALLATTAAGAWAQIGGTDLWHCTIDTSGALSAPCLALLDFSVTLRGATAGDDAMRLLGVSMHHDN